MISTILSTVTSVRDGVGTSFDNLTTPQQKWLVRAISLGLVLLLWEIAGRMLGPILFAPISMVIPTYLDLALSGPMIPTLIGSIQEMLIGYGLAVLFAVPIGLLMGRSSLAERTIEPWVSAFFVTSTSALLPLLILLVGSGFYMRITVVWLACVWHILLNIYHGAKGVDEEYLDVGRSFNVSRYKMFKSITLPATMPYVMAGLRMGLSRSLRGIILAETYILVGYGGLIGEYGNQSVTTEPVLALILTIMILGSGGATLLEKLQERFIPWADTDPSL